MKAAVIQGPGSIRYETVEDPKIENADDLILKVTSTAICGSDLHIYNGGIPQTRAMVLGHEFMGIVEETGSAVHGISRGDRILVPFPVACGSCYFCAAHLPGHCENSNSENYGPEGGVMTEKGGGLFGYTDLYGGYDGGQAQYVRVPYANHGPRIVPSYFTDEQLLFLTDIFPTGFAGVDWANVKGGESIVIFGAGPVGLMALKAAHLRKAGRIIMVDTQHYRLQKAHRIADCYSVLWENNAKEVVNQIRELTHGRGADVGIDAVGFEPDRNILERVKTAVNFELGSAKVLEACFSAVRRGGFVSVLGVYPSSYDNFPLGQFFDKGLRIQGGQVPVHNYIDALLATVQAGQVVLDDIISHRLPLSQVEHAYEIFNKKQDDCVKVVLDPWN